MLIALALFAAGSAFGAWAYRFLAIDECYDYGGAWDYAHGLCDGANPR